jgi:hypothetical protein
MIKLLLEAHEKLKPIMQSLVLPALFFAAKSIATVQPVTRGATGTITTLPTTTPAAASPTVSFPPVASIPRDFSPQGLEELWSLVSENRDATFRI